MFVERKIVCLVGKSPNKHVEFKKTRRNRVLRKFYDAQVSNEKRNDHRLISRKLETIQRQKKMVK